jgi:hypothetical protein
MVPAHEAESRTGEAIRCNLFVFKEKTKRISSSIGANDKHLAFLLLSTSNKKNHNSIQ